MLLTFLTNRPIGNTNASPNDLYYNNPTNLDKTASATYERFKRSISRLKRIFKKRSLEKGDLVVYKDLQGTNQILFKTKIYLIKNVTKYQAHIVPWDNQEKQIKKVSLKRFEEIHSQ